MGADAKSGQRVARILLGAAAAVAVSLTMPALAGAATPPPGDVGAIAQYSETIPTSRGDRLSGRGGGGAGASLPPAVTARVQSEAGDDADALLELATSPAHGAPERAPAPAPAAEPADETTVEAVPEPSFTEALQDAATSRGGGIGPLLVPLLVAIAAALIVAALLRRRSTTRPG